MKEGNITLSQTELAVIKLLAYYHVFHHPLTVGEITERIQIKGVDRGEIEKNLKDLVSTGAICEYNAYYFLEDPQSIVKRRQDGETRAKQLMKTAHRMSKVIYAFPFVRAVLISGSLSKGSVPEDADIDYFIITKKNRLWIARTLLVLFKRIFLLGSKKYFCVNYFVDEDHLEIPDKNIFTATEVTTLIPLRGKEFCQNFTQTNSWYKDFYPNISLHTSAQETKKFLKGFSRYILEPLFFQALAERLEKFFMKKTYARWMSMYGDGYSDKEFELAFRTHRGTSKNHDKNYQKKVLSAVEANMEKAINQIKVETVNG